MKDDLKKEEAMKRELKMRLAWASFLQETVHEMASYKAKADQGGEESGATELLDFIDKARHGEPIDNDIVIRIARLFKDEFTLSNIARPQLVTLCQYMGLQPYGADAFLRFQLKTKLRAIKDDDKRILWEGLHSLSLTELREACRERGMRAHGLREDTYRKQLQEWLDLSIQKHVPISLLIMSRAFALGRATTADVLSSSISSLDEDTINEVVLAAASKEEVDTVEMRKRKLESLEFQKELILDEREEAEDAKEELRAAKQANDEAEAAFALGPSSADEAERTSEAMMITTQKTVDPASQKEILQTETVFVEKVKDLREKISQEGAEQLSVAELETLMDLARDSSVEREKAALAILEAKIDAMRSSSSSSSDEEEQAEEVATALAEIEEHVTAAPHARSHGDLAPPTSPTSPTSTESLPSPSTSPRKEERKDGLGLGAKKDKNIEKMQDMLGGMLSKLKAQVCSQGRLLPHHFISASIYQCTPC
jgi:LETM1 and EF-hand domain-containing protein 1